MGCSLQFVTSLWTSVYNFFREKYFFNSYWVDFCKWIKVSFIWEWRNWYRQFINHTEYNGGSKVPITLNNSQIFPDIQFLEAIVIECPKSFFLGNHLGLSVTPMTSVVLILFKTSRTINCSSFPLIFYLGRWIFSLSSKFMILHFFSLSITCYGLY